ncbi:Casein kinase I-like protein [Zancudomyces culisetae]|uniref:non-specific serine/threonine protein kinase n=1 Tax=Zancudomyces culisetae TaxID=1213189 RepID=A0A1R1PNX0_ZANCU|nr:Casein kinase I-like protein [Zancudomyces culisetae]OMH82675.1 Casein kinase I-like protein [Zancudomyces culisetae]OMH84538.1 Casein kinase I-like protein [Zancudomyces culisetae]|eukprot:OMH79380.1 Casein kinase I-like protein [Zancudomyces culisetae]
MIQGSTNVVGVHYKVGKKIGEGSFGVIYEGVDLIKNKQIAIKFESRKSDAPQLRDEYRSYNILSKCDGIPRAYYFGQEGQYNVMVIDLLGPSLEDMFDSCRRRFSVKTTAYLCKQMITRIQEVHEKNLIYRDVKPDNFLLGRPNTPDANKVFMVDFGMAKYYRDPKTHQHIPYRERKSLSGTARYMSINTHLGREQSRRDDLESIGHVVMYFLRGSLPWQGLKAATNKLKYEKIGETKQHTGLNELCGNFPKEFAKFLDSVRKLSFEATPDYDEYRRLMDVVIANCGEPDDGVFDWMLSKTALSSESRSHQQNLAKANLNLSAAALNSSYNQFQASNQALRSFDPQMSRVHTPHLMSSASPINMTSSSVDPKSTENILNSSNARLSKPSAGATGSPVPISSAALNTSTVINSSAPALNAKKNEQNRSEPVYQDEDEDGNGGRRAAKRGFFAKLFSCSCFSST